MNILVSCDENYIKPLKAMLYSLFSSNKGHIDIYIMHSSIADDCISDLKDFVKKISDDRARLINIKIENGFEKAHTTFYYTSEMYFRLLAYKHLPEEIDRVLYLDPDILILNSLKDLYERDFEDKLFMAAVHTTPTVQSANIARLKLTSENKDIENYYNSGILMINLKKARDHDYEDKIISYINTSKKAGLLMPDQDLLNVVFRNDIKEIEELKYNYDARRFATYRVLYDYDLDDVFKNTCILHFCGKRKPWLESYSGKFNSLYQFIWQKAIHGAVAE